MTEETERPGPGRPRDELKRAAILDAARDLFYANGVGAVAIETVASTAGVSKVTIYNQFENKTKLFEAVVAREAGMLANEFRTSTPQFTSLEDQLNAIGSRIMTFALRDENVAFDRLLSLEASRHPDLAKTYFKFGPGNFREELAKIIADAERKGDISVENPMMAAEDLAMLWQGFLPLEKRLKLRNIPDKDIENRVRHGTRFFLKGARRAD